MGVSVVCVYSAACNVLRCVCVASALRLRCVCVASALRCVACVAMSMICSAVFT